MKLRMPGKKQLAISASALALVTISGVSVYALAASQVKKQESVASKAVSTPKVADKTVPAPVTQEQAPVETALPQSVATVQTPVAAPSKYPYATELSPGIWQVTDTHAVMAAGGVPAEDYDKADYVMRRSNAWRFAADGSYGIGQINISRVDSSLGDPTDPVVQMKWMQLECIKRYGSWQKAYDRTVQGNWVF